MSTPPVLTGTELLDSIWFGSSKYNDLPVTLGDYQPIPFDQEYESEAQFNAALDILARTHPELAQRMRESIVLWGNHVTSRWTGKPFNTLANVYEHVRKQDAEDNQPHQGRPLTTALENATIKAKRPKRTVKDTSEYEALVIEWRTLEEQRKEAFTAKELEYKTFRAEWNARVAEVWARLRAAKAK